MRKLPCLASSLNGGQPAIDACAAALPHACCCCWLPCPPAGEKVFEEYITEYSTDRIEMHKGAIAPGQRVLMVRAGGLQAEWWLITPRGVSCMQASWLCSMSESKRITELVLLPPSLPRCALLLPLPQVDDLVATGGTLVAGINLVSKCGFAGRSSLPSNAAQQLPDMHLCCALLAPC